MSKAKEIGNLDCAADAGGRAVEVLRLRFAEFAAFRSAALDSSDIGGVHDMRVAARRLRSALRYFTPLIDKSRLKKAGKELKQIADALGAVRDQDVAIAALEQLNSKAENESIGNGVNIFLEERRALRETARADLAGSLAETSINKLRDRFGAALEKAAAHKKNKRAQSFSESGRQAVIAGLNELFTLGVHIYQPFKRDELHEIRIAARRLRYAAELFSACWGKKIVPFAEQIAEMQSALGDVHDCDIWIAEMSGRLQNARKQDLKEGNEHRTAAWILSQFVKKRTKSYRSALELWNRWETENFAEKMRSAM